MCIYRWAVEVVWERRRKKRENHNPIAIHSNSEVFFFANAGK